MDDVIYQEFVGTGNMDLVLSQRCAELRLWPAIDIQQSGTRKEHLLLTQDEYNEMVSIRRRLSGKTETDAMAALIEYFDKFYFFCIILASTT
jgi:transcription termination factor Rho